MESKIPLAVGPVCKAKRFKINAQQMNCKDSCSHRWGCSNVPLGGSAAMEGRLTSEPRAAENGQHMELLEEIVGSKYPQGVRDPFQLSSGWDTPSSHAAEQLLK